MRRLLPILAAGVALAAPVVGCTDDVDTPGGGGAGDPSGAPPACAPELGEAFTAWAEAGFSGTVAVTTGGEPDCLAAYGTADEATGAPNSADTVFAIGSVSKAFTAAAVFALVDDGSLALTDRAGDLVPGLGGPAAGVTVEQLLLHTSGLTGDIGQDHEPLDRAQAVAALSGLQQAFRPGTDDLYSNAGYTLLALIVEDVSGSDHRGFVAARVLPLPGGEMAGGFWDGEPAAAGPRAIGVLEDGSTGQAGDFAGPHWAMAGNGDLAMTTRELATWTHALFTGQVVSPAAVERLLATRFDHGDGSAELPGWVALDEATFGEPALAAAGGGDTGHDTVVAWLPDSERVVAMASNTPEVTAEDLVQAVGPALVSGDTLPRPEGPAADVDPEEMAALAGTYELAEGGSFAVAAHEDGLEITATGPTAVSALFPLPEGGPTADDAAAHEDRVRALLAGETDEGREERDAVESEVGPITDVEVVGTIVADGELRTYVTIIADGEPVTGWYAVDEEGGVAAVDLGDGGPSLVVAPAGSGAFRPVDPTGRAADVVVRFGEDRMTVTGPAGSADARLSG